MTNALLFTIAAILGLGFIAISSLLVEIRDALDESCDGIRRLADALEDEFEDEDEWAVVRGKKFTPNGTEGPFGGKT